jgi:hypothetical protein
VLSTESVKPHKAAKGREVKSRFLNSLFSNKPKPDRTGSLPQRQPSLDPKRAQRDPSSEPQRKKQAASSPRAPKVAEKAGRGGSSARSLSSSRQRPAAGGLKEKSETAELVASKQKQIKMARYGYLEIGTLEGSRPSSRQEAKEEGKLRAPVAEAVGPANKSTRGAVRPSTKQNSATDEDADVSLSPRVGKGRPAPLSLMWDDKKRFLGRPDLNGKEGVTTGVNGQGLEAVPLVDNNGRPEAAVLEAVRDRLSSLGVGGFGEEWPREDDASEMEGEAEGDASEVEEVGGGDALGLEEEGEGDAPEMEEERRKERANSGGAASTKEEGGAPRRATSWTQQNRGDASASRRSWTGGLPTPSEEKRPTSPKGRKQSEWLMALREQNGKGGNTVAKSTEDSGQTLDSKQRARKPSEWLMALRERSAGEDAESPKEVVTDLKVSQNGGSVSGRLSEAEGGSSREQNAGKKVRGVVVPSRVWLDSSRKKDAEPDVESKAVDQGLRNKPAGNKPVGNGAPARQRAPFSSFSEAGHWLPSSPHKTSKTPRSSANSRASTPSESRAGTPSRTAQETVSAPASPSRTSSTSRRNSSKVAGSAPASPKKVSNPPQPRAGSRSRVRPLGGQQNGPEEGGGKVGSSPSKGVQKSGTALAARHARVLHNRWLQWCFVNARAQAALEAQQKTAEVGGVSVFPFWNPSEISG